MIILCQSIELSKSIFKSISSNKRLMRSFGRILKDSSQLCHLLDVVELCSIQDEHPMILRSREGVPWLGKSALLPFI